MFFSFAPQQQTFIDQGRKTGALTAGLRYNF